MHTLLLVTFILQIANGGIVSSAFKGDWVRDAVDPNGKALGRVTWRISIGEDHLTLAESYQGYQFQAVIYNLDGTQIEDSTPIPESLSRDVLRMRRLKIKGSNELELTKVYRASVIVETLTLSKDALNVVSRMRQLDDRSPIKPPADRVYSFRRVTDR